MKNDLQKKTIVLKKHFPQTGFPKLNQYLIFLLLKWYLISIIVFVKRKIYAILLLLSFLVVLTHDIIPHHHHDCDTDALSSSHNHDEKYAHHEIADHHHNDEEHQNHNVSDDAEKEHNHTFPLHHHISPTNDFDYLRNELIRIIAFNLPLLAFLNFSSDTSLSEPPEICILQLFTDKPFFISALFKPGAIGLRAPPSIA